MTNPKKITPYIENVCEATAACLFTMVQGNFLLLGVSHWLIASQTGIIAGILASAALLLAKSNKPWIISLVLGFITGIVDFFIHPGMFGSVATEAIVTGIAAAILSYLVSTIIVLLRNKKKASDATLVDTES